jgi:hypothetical protein
MIRSLLSNQTYCPAGAIPTFHRWACVSEDILSPSGPCSKPCEKKSKVTELRAVGPKSSFCPIGGGDPASASKPVTSSPDVRVTGLAGCKPTWWGYTWP